MPSLDPDEHDYDADDFKLCAIWNKVTKEVEMGYSAQEAEVEIRKKKHPDNWVALSPDSCWNCGGSWDGNQNCSNFCSEIVRGSEEPANTAA